MKDKRTVVFSVKVVLPVEDNSSNFEATTRKVFKALHGHFDNYEVLIDDERTSLRNQLLREFVFQRHTASLKDPLLVVHPEELAQMAARLADAVIEVMTNPIQNIVSLRDVTGEALYTRVREQWRKSAPPFSELRDGEKKVWDEVAGSARSLMSGPHPRPTKGIE